MSDKYKMGVEVNISNKESAKSDSVQTQQSRSAPSADSPFNILILGDFSGREYRGLNQADTLSKRKLLHIDRDNFEDVMAKMEVQSKITLSDTESIELAFSELDDFHPDALYENLESFEKLRSLRRRLKNNTSFSAAAAEMQGWLTEATTVQVEDASVEQTSSDSIASDGLLDNILSQQSDNSTSRTQEKTQIDRLIRSIVAPYVEPASDPRQDEMVAIVDEATQSHMRAILHHPAFQQTESIWQSVYFLIKRLETGSRLNIYLMDVTKQELDQDLATDELSSSGLYKKLCDSAEGDIEWAVMLGCYTFADKIEDALLLGNIGGIASQAEAVFLAAANETLYGCDAMSSHPDYEDWTYQPSSAVKQAWDMLRASPMAESIGLTSPRFLLRLPYGKKSKPIDAFDFEEMPMPLEHQRFLWGNSAFLKVECLARNFLQNAWSLSLATVFETDNLPVYYYQDEGETVSQPVAEILLTERGGEKISAAGIIPIWSVRDMDKARSTNYFSLAENNKPVKGKWS